MITSLPTKQRGNRYSTTIHQFTIALKYNGLTTYISHFQLGLLHTPYTYINNMTITFIYLFIFLGQKAYIRYSATIEFLKWKPTQIGCTFHYWSTNLKLIIFLFRKINLVFFFKKPYKLNDPMHVFYFAYFYWPDDQFHLKQYARFNLHMFHKLYVVFINYLKIN